MGQDGSIEFNMRRISLAVVELQRSQEFGCPTEMSGKDWRVNDLTGQDGSTEIEMEQIDPVIVVLQRVQHR